MWTKSRGRDRQRKMGQGLSPVPIKEIAMKKWFWKLRVVVYCLSTCRYTWRAAWYHAAALIEPYYHDNYKPVDALKEDWSYI